MQRRKRAKPHELPVKTTSQDDRAAAGARTQVRRMSTRWRKPAAQVVSPILRCSQYGLSHCLRQCDRAEERLRVEIVRSGFVDNPQKAMLLGLGITQHHVDFSLLERCRITLVLDAYDELFRLYLCHGFALQSRCLILNSLRPIPAASYQCISATWTEPSANRARAIPLRLRQRPRPYVLRSRAISRIPEPVAKVSTSENSRDRLRLHSEQVRRVQLREPGAVPRRFIPPLRGGRSLGALRPAIGWGVARDAQW
jgi:hypothetical protein